MQALRRVIAAVALSTAAGICCTAEGVALGFVTGSDYIALGDVERTHWVRGAIDGIIAEDLAARSTGAPWLGRCAEGITLSQFRAIFEKELDANPESWHAPAALIMRSRFHAFCSSRGAS